MIEAPVLSPEISGNPRIETIYASATHLPNREHTLNAVGRPLYRDPLVKQDPDIQAVLDDNVRVIVTPRTVSRMGSERRAGLRTLASPLESGRVLELDEPLELDGFPHTITIKGVGATTFWRSPGNEGPFAVIRRHTPQDRVQLERFPFLGHSGVFTSRDAVSEVIASNRLRRAGIDAERVLAVYTLDQIPNAAGVLRPYRNFVGRGSSQITPESRPVLMFRAMKTNFRLLDLYMLRYLGAEPSIPILIGQTMEQFEHLDSQENPTLQEYLHWISGKMLIQELPLAVGGYDLSSTRRWSDLARNVSMLGEKLDLEALKQNGRGRQSDSFEYGMHFRANFGNIVDALNNFGQNLGTYGGDFGKVDAEAYSEHFWQTVSGVIEGLNMEQSTLGMHPKVLQRHGIDKSTFGMWLYRQMLQAIDHRYKINESHELDPFFEYSLSYLDAKARSKAD